MSPTTAQKSIAMPRITNSTTTTSPGSHSGGKKRKAAEAPSAEPKVFNPMLADPKIKAAIDGMEPAFYKKRRSDSPKRVSPPSKLKLNNGADARYQAKKDREDEMIKRYNEEEKRKREERNAKARERYNKQKAEREKVKKIQSAQQDEELKHSACATMAEVAQTGSNPEDQKQNRKRDKDGDDNTSSFDDSKKKSTSPKHDTPHPDEQPSRKHDEPPPAKRAKAPTGTKSTKATASGPKVSKKPQVVATDGYNKIIRTKKTWFKSSKPGMSKELLNRGFDWFTMAYCEKVTAGVLADFILKDDVTPQPKIEEKIREKDYLAVSCEDLQARLAERRKDAAQFRKDLEDYTRRRDYGGESFVESMISGEDTRKKLARLSAALDWLDASRALDIKMVV